MRMILQSTASLTKQPSYFFSQQSKETGFPLHRPLSMLSAVKKGGSSR